MAFQNSVPQNPVIGVPGSSVDSSIPRDAITVFAEVDSTAGGPLSDSSLGILPGYLVVRGTGIKQARLPHALAANADAVIVLGVSDTVAQDLGPLDFDGQDNPDGIGPDRWPVPTLVDLVLDNNADWLATNATLTGIGEDGGPVSEVLAIPAGGNATVSTNNRYVQITRLEIPIQGGATGTYTLGVQGAAAAALTKTLIQGIATNDRYREGRADPNGIPLGGDGTPYTDTQDFAAARLDRVWVRTEDQCLEGSPVFARLTNTAAAGSPSNIGQLRSDADGGNAAIVPGAQFRQVEGTIAEVEVNFRL